MKYYLPLSSLNLGLILRSECIAPAPLYPAHAFETLPALRGVNATVLFDRPVSFTLRDSSRLNYPMLLEVESPERLTSTPLQPLGDGIFAATSVLRLPPTACRIFFFSKKACDVTLAGLRDDKSLKFFSDYRILASARTLRPAPMPKIGPCTLQLHPSDESAADRIKGAAFTFLLGQHLKSTPELAHFKKLSQEIYDQTTGILANPRFADRLKERLLLLLKEFKAIDPTEKSNRMAFDARLTSDARRFGLDKKQLIAINEEWGTWGQLYSTLSRKWGFRLLPLASELTAPEHYSALRAEVERRTASTIADFRRATPAPDLSAFRPQASGVSIDGMPLVSALIDFIISRRLTRDSLMADRSAIIAEISTMLFSKATRSGIAHEEWRCIYHPYFQSLSEHLANITRPFSPLSVASTEIRAIALFLMRFNNLSDLLALMNLLEIPDPTPSLALYGALTGYSALDRDLLAPVINSSDYAKVFRLLSATLYNIEAK